MSKGGGVLRYIGQQWNPSHWVSALTTHRVPSPSEAMTFDINTHDSWGVVNVGKFQSIEEARKVFTSICEDPWYMSDGTVKGVELVDNAAAGQRLDWFAFR